MSTRDWRARVDDILQAIADTWRFTDGMDQDEFIRDTKTIYAVSFAIGVIGEAARAIPADVKDRHMDIPWEKMQSMRNLILHEYFRVDLAILWDTATVNLPLLIEPLRQMLSDTESD